MKTITLLNSKGGVGKTTLSINVAAAFDKSDYDVCLMDTDAQGNLRDWHELSDRSISLFFADKKNRLIEGYRYFGEGGLGFLVIDTPGKLLNICSNAISISDLVVIPLTPSPLDLWGTIDMIDLVNLSLAANPKLKACFLINQVDVRSNLIHSLYDAIKDIQAPRIKLLETRITGRVDYARSLNNGKTIFDSGNVSAIIEIESLQQEIMEILK